MGKIPGVTPAFPNADLEAKVNAEGIGNDMRLKQLKTFKKGYR